MNRFIYICVYIFFNASFASLICDSGSEEFSNSCWCSKDFFGPNGQPPCFQCGNGSFSRLSIGSDVCLCKSNFNSVDGTAPCDRCPQGSYSNGEAATFCKCSVGYAGSDGKAPCSQCPEGATTYSVQSNDYYWAWFYDAFWAIQMYYNYLTEGDTKSTCFCKPGYKGDVYGPAGQNKCTLCSEGSKTIDRFDGIDFFSPGQVECLCEPGYYSSDGTDTYNSCTPCPEGTLSTTYGSQTCNYCAKGYYSTNGMAPCTKCPTGSTTLNALSASATGLICSYCEIGFFSPTGNSPCSPCPEGHTNSLIGSTSCDVVSGSPIPTVAITSAPSGPSLEPSVAPSGPTPVPTKLPTYTRFPSRSSKPTTEPTVRPTTEDVCPLGYFSFSGNRPCELCPEGRYTSATGLSECDICSAGFYGSAATAATAAGMSACQPCPWGTTSNAGDKHCIPCFGPFPCSQVTMDNIMQSIGQLQSNISAILTEIADLKTSHASSQKTPTMLPTRRRKEPTTNTWKSKPSPSPARKKHPMVVVN